MKIIKSKADKPKKTLKVIRSPKKKVEAGTKEIRSPKKKVKKGTSVRELGDLSNVPAAVKTTDFGYKAVALTPQRFPLAGQDMSNVTGRTLDNYAAQALSIYGSYVVEDRAVCDIRDGLKPVHRAILWSMSGLGLKYSGSFKKAARTVGDALGRFHPHGDQAAYGAMVTIANTLPPAVAGQGNWGTPIDNAAAMRYTEAKISRFSSLFLLDADYLKVTPMIPNFSNDDVIPLHLPALLPYIFFNSTVPAPAYGVKAGHPSFTFKSVAQVVVRMLEGEDFGAKDLTKVLKFNHSYGCHSQPMDKSGMELISTGRGAVNYTPIVKIDEKKRIIYIQTFVPGGFSAIKGIDAKLAKISTIEGVASASSTQGKKNKNAGPHGACWDIIMRRGVSDDRMSEIAQEVEKQVTCRVSYALGVTIRHADRPNDFEYMNFVKYFRSWIDYRIALEVDMIKYRIARLERERHINEVYLYAVDNLDKLLKAMPKILSAKDVDAACAKALKLPLDDAKIVMSRQLRQLARMERKDLVDKIKAATTQLKAWAKDLKNPGMSAARDTKERVSSYLKAPDKDLAGPL